jgi:hypothetical protein
MLPAVVAAGTALITTAMVQVIYGLVWLGQYLLDAMAPSYDWAGALTVSCIVTSMVLLASMIALRLMADRPADDVFTTGDLTGSGEQAAAAFRIAGTPE